MKITNIALFGTLLGTPIAMCSNDAHADDAAVQATELNDSGQTADSSIAPVLGIIGDGVKLSEVAAGALNLGSGCTVANACITYFDPQFGQSNSTSTTNAARREAIRDAMIAWRGKYPNGTFQIGIAPSQNDSDFNALASLMVNTVAVPTLVPTFAPSNQTNSRATIHAGSTVMYAPVGFFGTWVDENHVPTGTYKTAAGTGIKQVYTPGDGGELLAPGAGVAAAGLPFTSGQHVSLPFAAAAAAAWTLGAPLSVVGLSTAFTTLTGSSSVKQLPSGNF
jgi:hypothetical protein